MIACTLHAVDILATCTEKSNDNAIKKKLTRFDKQSHTSTNTARKTAKRKPTIKNWIEKTTKPGIKELKNPHVGVD